jgi:hypothetical protein
MDTIFKKGDLRRLWFVLGAVAELDSATLTTIVKATGMPKASVNDLLIKIMNGQIPTLELKKVGPVYSIESWGELVKKKGVISYFNACKVGLSDL